MFLESLFCSINESNSFLLCPTTIRVYSQATLYATCYIKRGKKENSSCFYYSCVDLVTSHFISWQKIVTVWNRHFTKYLKKEFIRLQWNFQDDGFFPDRSSKYQTWPAFQILFDIQLNTNQKRVNQCNKYSWRTRYIQRALLHHKHLYLRRRRRARWKSK